MPNRRILYVKSNPTSDHSVGMCLGHFDTSHIMGSNENGSTALGNGMTLNYVDLDVTIEQQGEITALTKKVNDVDTPTALENI